MKGNNGSMLVLSLIIMLAVVLGCGGGATCRSELTVAGETFTGLDSKEEQAVTNSCTKYCIDGDPDFDLAHKKWLETPEAQKVSERNNKWAAYAMNKDLRAMVDRCTQRCKEFIKDGVYKVRVECK